MKLTCVVSFVIIVLLTTTQILPLVFAVESVGLEIDVLRFKVICFPEDQIEAMLTSEIDVLTGIGNDEDIVMLGTEGFTICGRDAFQPGLLGIAKSPGYSHAPAMWAYLNVHWPHYGADNMLTYLDINWESGHPNERIEDGKSVVIWCLENCPMNFNPLWSGGVGGKTWPAWKFYDKVFDPLIAVNPYNLNDIPWIATDWEVVETPPSGYDVTYYLRDDVFWQDGLQYTAWDAEFSLEFMRDNVFWYLDDLIRLPQYPPPPWRFIEDVEVINDYAFTVHANVTDLGYNPPVDSSLFYHDYAICATLLPPQIWADWDGEICSRNLAAEPGWNGVTPTNLFGTGPFIFQFYDETNMTGDLWVNQNYLLTPTAIHDLRTDMFWEAGDYNRDGIINVVDMVYVYLAYGTFQGEPGYDSEADFNKDGIVDMTDLVTVAYHLLWKIEYP